MIFFSIKRPNNETSDIWVFNWSGSRRSISHKFLYDAKSSRTSIDFPVPRAPKRKQDSFCSSTCFKSTILFIITLIYHVFSSYDTTFISLSASCFGRLNDLLKKQRSFALERTQPDWVRKLTGELRNSKMFSRVTKLDFVFGNLNELMAGVQLELDGVTG